MKRDSEKRRPATHRVIALDLGGTKLAAAFFTRRGAPLLWRQTMLDGREGKAVGKLIAREVRRLTAAAVDGDFAVSGIGISVPGIVDQSTGRVWAPNIPGWEDYPLAHELRGAANSEKIRVAVESDRAASILGEAWHGAARGCRDAIFLAVGTGIGVGIMSDGRIIAGAHGIAGAIGWLALRRPYRPEYADCGCFESGASGHGIANVAKALVARRKGYRGPLRRRALTAHDVFTAYDAGDEIAKEVLGQAVELWGMACANLVSLFNPQKIIFGGGVFGPAAQFLPAISAEARRWAQPIAIEQVAFEVSQLGGDAALYGAASLACGRASVRRSPREKQRG